MKVHTEAEYNRLYQETLSYERAETNIRGFDRVKSAKSQWSEEQNYHSHLSSGIELDISDQRIFLERNRFIEHGDCSVLTAKYYLNGCHNVICHGIEGVATEYSETKGQNYLFHLPDIEEIEQYSAGDRLQRLRINIDFKTIRRFAIELDTVPRELQRLIEDENPQRFHFNVGGITSQMQTVMRQILQHPYQGAIARMYMEAKVLELLAMQLAQFTEFKPYTAKKTLQAKSIDCVYQAKDILATSLENPPSILELAQQVGVSERTLRRGFRKLFKTTVVGYLTLLRMEQAEKLLREGEFSISEVANLVGYSHLGNFSTAFKRQFGIAPSQCMAGQKIL